MHPQPDRGAPTPLDDIPVETVPTPNPDALMFRVHETLVPNGTYEYKAASEADPSPLATRIFAIPGVELVLIAPRFVTVVKDQMVGWPDMVPTVKGAVRAFLASGEMAVFDADEAGAGGALSEVEQRIVAIIDDEIRPAIAQDGGDVTYLGFEDGIVKLSLIGACGTCPSSITTLQHGIQSLLMEEIPEVRGVEQV